MRKWRLSRTVMLAVTVLASACGSGAEAPVATSTTAAVVQSTVPPTEATTTTTAPTTPVIDPAVTATLARYTDWTIPTKVSVDSRPLQDTEWVVAKTKTSCMVDPPRTVSRVFDELAAFPFSGPLLPGLIVEGSGVVDGDLRVIPLERAPLTVVSSLDSANPVVVVDQPTVSSLQEAVSVLKRDADAQFTGIDVTPADITYVREEVYSFEEAFLAMGVSLHYESPAVRGRFDSSFQQEQASEKHSIVARLVQPMFTLRVDSSAIRAASDHFSPTTSAADLERLEGSGVIGPASPPLIIDSVTYGRVMYFTMTSTTVASASELELAVEAAWGNIGGEADLTQAQRNILASSRLEVIAYGGDQDVAFQALRNGRLEDFFTRVNTTTAAPLSMTVRTLDGDLVAVADEATVRSVTCDQVQLPYGFAVSVEGLNGFTRIRVNGQYLDEFESPAVVNRVVSIPTGSLRPGANEVEVGFVFPFPCLAGKITVNILVDGSAAPGSQRSHAGAACNFDWKWTINTDNGSVVKS